jgi:hypothetical protein
MSGTKELVYVMEAEAASEKILATRIEHLTSRLCRERADHLATTIERDLLKVRVQQLEKMIEKLSDAIDAFPNTHIR